MKRLAWTGNIMTFGSNQVSGAIVNATAGENLVFGNVCYYKSDSKYYKADSGDAATMSTQNIMALESISADAAGWFIEKGYVYDSGWSFTTGAAVYVGTAGAATETEPAVSKIIGMGDGTDLYFDPSRDSGTIGLGEVLQIVTKSGAYTLDGDDDVIIATGTFTIKTPATESTGKKYYIKNKGSGTITIDANDLTSTTIDDETTQTLTQYDCMAFAYDGTEYWII